MSDHTITSDFKEPRRFGKDRMRRLGTESGVRLQTQVLLRWLAVAGQLAAVLMVDFALGFDLPLGMCLGAIAASAWLNVFLAVRYPTTRRLPDGQAALYFGYDVLQLAVLLYLTGGLANPFALLFLVPVTISATTLSLRSTVSLWFLAAALVSFLAFFHRPLPWQEGEPLVLDFLYILGIWVALELGLGFMAVYAWRIAQESKRMSDALTATQLVLAREQRLSAIDGLAAAAAHELGTPLGTISLVTKELQRGLPDEEQLREDLALLHSQAERCRDILSRLTRQPDERDALLARQPVSLLLNEIVDPYRGSDVSIQIELEAEGETTEPIVPRDPEIMYGLGNLVENASDFAEDKVIVKAVFSNERMHIRLIDDGPGFPADILEKLGEPYITTRPRSGLADEREEHEGMGLGFFIAKTFLERSGADVSIANRGDGVSGAIVTVEWPRAVIEAGNRGD